MNGHPGKPDPFTLCLDCNAIARVPMASTLTLFGISTHLIEWSKLGQKEPTEEATCSRPRTLLIA